MNRIIWSKIKLIYFESTHVNFKDQYSKTFELFHCKDQFFLNYTNNDYFLSPNRWFLRVKYYKNKQE